LVEIDGAPVRLDFGWNGRAEITDIEKLSSATEVSLEAT
jgi:hypothetical protein